MKSLVLSTILVAILPFAASDPLVGQEKIDFGRQIKPILAENCFACHGIDAEARAADLRLDVRDSAIESAIVPGNPDDSPFVERIFDDEPDFVMPPPETHKQLTDDEKNLLERWVAEGADYQRHWSLIAPARPPLPAVKNSDWVRNAIDQFILARLERKGLSPAREADPRNLLRRLSLDITGLPPSPSDSEKFATDYQDRGDEAMSDWIDRLMESPSWGEHRARYWLDAARYADTHGMHYDNYREMWPYRDWVIRSFNSNQPFDRFTIEQLAGDLLDSPTQEQLIATGFQRCNMTTNEGGTIDEENLAIYAADRVQTFGWVYLGLTTNCCQCHDHKFDPLSMKDYYSLAAFFRNTTQPAKDGNRKDGMGPVITVPSPDDENRWRALPDEIATATRERDARREAARPAFEKWLASLDAESLGSLPTDGLVLHLPMNEGSGNEIQNQTPKPISTREGKPSADQAFTASGKLSWEKDGVIGPAPRLTRESTIELGNYGDFAIDQPYSVGCWVKATKKHSGAIVGRMDNKKAYRGWDVWQNNGEFATHIIDKWTENGLKVSTTGNRVKPGTWQHVLVTWDGSGKPHGLKIYIDGKIAETHVETGTLKAGADPRIDTPLCIGRRSTGQYPFDGFIQDFVLFERRLESAEVANIAESGPLRLAIETPIEQRSEELNETLMGNFLRNHDPRFIALDGQIARLTAEQETIQGRSPVTHVQVEKSAQPMAHVLMRGAYDKPGEQVTAAPPASLHGMPPGAPANRLGLAQWVIDPENPLTARVTVNRFWQELFGRGIVATSEDFGVMGTPPINQDLLDWLAVEFRESGWNVKQFYKLILTSATYRQSSVTTEEKRNKDRDNSLLSRGPRFRMDAEMVRDYALAVSGLLSKKMYGPGARPYQPGNLWDIVGLPGGDTRKYVQDSGPSVYRRSLYSFWKRMSPPPNLETFNAPNREVCTVRRERTNTPLQALVTLNDPQFFEAARILAQNAIRSGNGDPEKTLAYISTRTVCRPLKQSEVTIMEDGRNEFLQHYRKNMADAKALIAFGQAPVDQNLDAAELAAWTLICNQMLNLDEVLNK